MARLTDKWTPTLEEAFGESGKKGKLGEDYMMEVFKSWGWECELHESDKKLQMDGIDITFKNPKWFNSYTCDVKNNMNKYGTFYVHEDWLFKGKSDRIFHVNPDTNWIVWYERKQMQDYYNGPKGGYIQITTKTQPRFVSKKFIDHLEGRKQ